MKSQNIKNLLNQKLEYSMPAADKYALLESAIKELNEIGADSTGVKDYYQSFKSWVEKVYGSDTSVNV